MTIYYSPTYSGFTFTDLKGKGNILFDGVVADTGKLINLLCLHGGLHYELHDGTERLIAYYKAIRKFTAVHPNHILAKSFAADGLNTAKVCLAWRDALVFAGWSKEVHQPSDRMKVLCGIEQFFDCKGTTDIIAVLTKEVGNGCTLPNDLDIVTPCDYRLFHPAIVRLIDALIGRGAKVTTLKGADRHGDDNLSQCIDLVEGKGRKDLSFTKDDNSLQILHFEEKDDALRYLSLQSGTAYDVWIDGDSKSLDNWLRLMGKPTTGSVVSQCIPQISQLFVIGLSLFSKPLNVNMLLEWLYAPMTPVGHLLAGKLSGVIVAKGGYFNKECQEVIDKYLNGEYDKFDDGITEEQKKEVVKKRRKTREKAVGTFLPDMKGHQLYAIDDTNNDVDTDRLYAFTTSLGAWCRQQMTMADDAEKVAQLSKVASETDAVQLLLDDYEGGTIPFAVVENWMGSLYKYADYSQYEAQRGCRHVIASPGNIAGQSRRTIWCDFMGGGADKLSYSFLSPKEKRAFREELTLWDESKEQEYRRRIMLLPFTQTSDELVLVTYNRAGGQETEKHPLMIQLEQQAKDLGDITRQPSLDESLYQDAEIIDNKNKNNNADEFIHLHHPELIQFPKYESYSSLSNMFQSPLDYTFQSIAQIYPVGASAMSPIWTTKGNVAHAVIQTLFWDKDDKQSGYPERIERNLKENYDKVFASVVNAYGAIMLLEENRIDTRTYKEQLRQCAQRLLEIVKVNALHVTGIESFVKNTLGFDHDIDLLGFIDMRLAKDDGTPYIFDFKWSGNQKWFSALLRQNKSLQLSLYRALINSLEEKQVGGIGYFLMPEGRMVTTGGIGGDLVSTIEIDDERKGSHLIQEMRNSYAYRRQQLECGLIELGDGEGLEALQYGKDEIVKDLVPLDTDDNGNKAANRFSNYEIFKRK